MVASGHGVHRDFQDCERIGGEVGADFLGAHVGEELLDVCGRGALCLLAELLALGADAGEEL